MTVGGGWTFAAGPWQSMPTTELSKARSRNVTWRLTGNHEASLSIGGDSYQSYAIQELVWDLWVLRNGRALFRGRFGPSGDTADTAGALATTFSAADYRALLQRRILFEGDTLDFTNADQSDIAWTLLGNTQSKLGGNLGIARGLGAVTGVRRDRSTYLPGDNVGTCLDQLSQVINGFDWDIRPSALDTSMTFDVFYPARGVDQGVVLDYGGRVSAFSRAVDPGAFGNAVRGTGNANLTPIRQEASGLGSDPAGRWDLQYANDGIGWAQTLADKTAATLAAGQYVLPSWEVTLAPGSWQGPDDFWLGDQVTLAVRAGRLNVVQSLRVVEINLDLDENDVETIKATLGAPNPALRRMARVVDKRLSALERR